MARGLSPLARGTLSRLILNNTRRRFIPAGAGNTVHWFYINHILPVYPRWRGEHVRNVQTIEIRNGLSPLARGTH
ncbi:hypothetical protein SEEN539_18052 [Salmonella enterica subsp. enterica serovar Newport str. CVM 21539]|nr:hypothetical protein SEEN539_18052 [Salmonella enterica subsp. enterica serovar Newport str. CVM 21539]EIZ95662.1 hypothetical protein SEEN185_06387 [Salmonella enterica subsp. enterica serovar Newport str. CVM 35185]EIZ96148.1 hypothetical protein SEEN199_08608 [Salmonella enterica subsp. enterica serovar Newport str. CVM 35199]KMU28926.1 hypothetical protein SEEN2RVB_16002 [Salmonella enterica subsp. enterica serovar Newport str. A182RVB]KMU45019.1 hypothetical protein SEEN2TTA_24163 [Salm